MFSENILCFISNVRTYIESFFLGPQHHSLHTQQYDLHGNDWDGDEDGDRDEDYVSAALVSSQ